MSKQNTGVLTLSVIAAGAIAEARFVSSARAQAGAGVNSYGVSEMAAAAAGERIPVTNLGTGIVETGAAIAAGALVESDAQGRAVTRTTGVILGRLAPGEVATAAGQFVEIVLIPN